MSRPANIPVLNTEFIFGKDLPKDDQDLFYKFWGIFGNGPHYAANSEAMYPAKYVDLFYESFLPFYKNVCETAIA